MFRYRRVYLGVLAATYLAISINHSSAQDKVDFDAKSLFRSLCASCHGLTGDGDGPVADALKFKMKPFSKLAARNDGEFPRYRVEQIIDGREDVNAHGSRLMPVWGTYYREKHQGSGADESARTIINFLVQYIEAMQQK